MERRSFLGATLAGLAGLFAPQEKAQPTEPEFGSHVLAVSVFAGQGNVLAVDTGLRYRGHKVSPTFVSITPTGFQTTAAVGVFPHHTDPTIDVQISDGSSWVGCAYYIQ